MNHLLSIFVVAISLWGTSVLAYSGGAPLEVCDDMVPKHGVGAKRSRFPYSVVVSQSEIKPGEKIKITVSGEKNGKTFKGFLLQVRDSNGKAVGTFSIPDDHRYAKTIACHGKKFSSATQKNSATKKTLTLDWTAPQKKGDLTVYATVVEGSSVFWTRQPTVRINIL